jgi:hypothetical protein
MLLSTLAKAFRFHTEYHTGRWRCKSCALRHIQFHSGNPILTVGNRVPRQCCSLFFAAVHNVTIKGLVESIPNALKIQILNPKAHPTRRRNQKWQ